MTAPRARFARRASPRLAIGLLGVMLGGCAAEPAPFNLLILTLDTTRGDRFGTTGWAEARTPSFDAWAASEAVQFDQAVTAVPITLPSHTTIMTGTYPVFHGVHDNDGFVVDDGLTTLAEMLGPAGWTTGAVVAAYPLSRQFNLDQGFATYDDDFQSDWTDAERSARTPLTFGFIERKAERVNAAVERWLEAHGSERFFLWAHYFDPHQAYEPPAPYDSQFAGSAYDGEIAYVDEQFGRLLGMLDARGLRGNTVIVVVGDHGESLGQHGEPTHASFVYDSTLHVPLWIAVPDRYQGGRRVSQLVQTVDIVPTVLDLLGLPPGTDVQGRSLLPLLEDPAAPWETEAYAESHFTQYHYGWGPLRAVRTERYKLVRAPRPELYDLVDDPDEQVNLAARRPEVLAEMAERLERLARRHAASDRARSVATAADPEAQAKLAALGYTGAGTGSELRSAPFPAPDALAAMPNATDKGLVLDYINLVNNLLRAKRFDDAARTARQALQIDPTNASLHLALARGLGVMGRFDAALAAVFEARTLQPDIAESYLIEGHIRNARGEWEQALAAFEAGAERGPDSPETLRMLARVLTVLGRFGEAVEHLQAYLAIEGDDWEVYLDLGEIQTRAGDAQAARDAFQRALELNPYSPQVLYNIGVFYRYVENFEFAARMFEGVLKVSPDHLAARVQLAEMLLADPEQQDRARLLLEEVLQRSSDDDWAARAEQILLSMG